MATASMCTVGKGRGGLREAERGEGSGLCSVERNVMQLVPATHKEKAKKMLRRKKKKRKKKKKKPTHRSTDPNHPYSGARVLGVWRHVAVGAGCGGPAPGYDARPGAHVYLRRLGERAGYCLRCSLPPSSPQWEGSLGVVSYSSIFCCYRGAPPHCAHKSQHTTSSNT